MTYPSVLEQVCSSWGKQRKRRACDESLMMPASWCLANEYSQCRPCWPFIFSMQPHIQCQWFSICDLKFIVILYTLTKIPPPEYTNWILEWDQKPRPGDPRDKLPKYPQKIQPGDPPKENGCYWRRGKSRLSLEKAEISAKHKRIASRKRLKVNLKPVPLADSEGWLQDKRYRETKASCCLKGKNQNLWRFFHVSIENPFLSYLLILRATVLSLNYISNLLESVNCHDWRKKCDWPRQCKVGTEKTGKGDPHKMINIRVFHKNTFSRKTTCSYPHNSL